MSDAAPRRRKRTARSAMAKLGEAMNAQIEHFRWRRIASSSCTRSGVSTRRSARTGQITCGLTYTTTSPASAVDELDVAVDEAEVDSLLAVVVAFVRPVVGAAAEALVVVQDEERFVRLADILVGHQIIIFDDHAVGIGRFAGPAEDFVT